MLSRSPALHALVLAAGLAGCGGCSDEPADAAARAIAGDAGVERDERTGPPFPRIASYWIESSLDPEAERAIGASDLAVVEAEAGALEPGVLARMRAKSPALELLAYFTSEEVPHAPDPAERPLAAARLARIAPAMWLVEPGSRLAAPVSPRATRIPVADPRAFSVARPRSPFYPSDEQTYLLLGGEHVRLLGVEGDELVVERAYRSAAAPHAAGTPIAAHVVFFSGTWMLDVASGAPADPEAGRWRDLLAEEAARLVAEGPWTGVFLDVCFDDIGFLNGGLFDTDRDGTADDPREASRRWARGMGELVGELRRRLGADAPIVANPGAQNCGHDALDGILLEGWPVGLPDGYLEDEVGLSRYLAWSGRPRRRPLTIANAFSPRLGFGPIGPGRDEAGRTDLAAMRLGLATALLGDGHYAFDNGVFGHYVAWRYDEYDGGGLGRGWLGWPLGPHRRLADGALVREFDGGMAIANPTEAPVEVQVPPGLSRLRGAQDPAHNDGSAVGEAIVVPARDGILLVRPGARGRPSRRRPPS